MTESLRARTSTAVAREAAALHHRCRARGRAVAGAHRAGGGRRRPHVLEHAGRSPTPRLSTGTGGLSGKALWPHTARIVGEVREATAGAMPITACGGVFTAEDALTCLQAGATTRPGVLGPDLRGPDGGIVDRPRPRVHAPRRGTSPFEPRRNGEARLLVLASALCCPAALRRSRLAAFRVGGSDEHEGEDRLTDAAVAMPRTALRPWHDGVAVSLEQVVKRFGDVTAVDGVDLEVREGEFFSMLGPSGSGKTTCLRMIAGFEQPTEGRILLGGTDVSGLPPYQRDVNTVFQDYALFPHMTVAQNVAYGLMVTQGGQVGAIGACRRGPRHGALGGVRTAQARPALRRSAPAGRAGPRPGHAAAGAAAGRAAGRARPQAAPADADRAEGHPAGRAG